MTSKEIREWAKSCDDIYDVLDRVSPKDIILLTDEYDIYRDTILDILGFSKATSRASLLIKQRLADIEELCGNDRKL